jgi:hypothetical protein
VQGGVGVQWGVNCSTAAGTLSVARHLFTCTECSTPCLLACQLHITSSLLPLSCPQFVAACSFPILPHVLLLVLLPASIRPTGCGPVRAHLGPAAEGGAGRHLRALVAVLHTACPEHERHRYVALLGGQRGAVEYVGGCLYV